MAASSSFDPEKLFALYVTPDDTALALKEEATAAVLDQNGVFDITSGS
jgi:hypothetical protein